MKIKFLGHACFVITSEKGIKILTDPYRRERGITYSPINENVDIITASHDHYDHGNIAIATGSTQVIQKAGIKAMKGIEIKGIASFHDEAEGKQRGPNIIFCFNIDGMNVCHLGDLGHRLSAEQVAQIGRVDILLVPVGGTYTIDASMAGKVCEDLKPGIVIPMHFKTPQADFVQYTIEDFVKGKKNVKRQDGSEAEITSAELPRETEILVLKPAKI